MSVKHEIITLLEQNADVFLSGQELAQHLHVSRAAVWKAVSALRDEGYVINAATNRGYCLGSDSNRLSEQGIRAYLAPNNSATDIKIFDSVGSTNSEAKKLAIDGTPDGTIIVSDEQTAGRGRGGRFFFSPKGSGVYMSVVLRPLDFTQSPQLITIYTALAVCKTLERLTGAEPRIKWVNDIFLGDLKICGILTEAIGDLESGQVESIIIGVGINVTTKSFPPELLGIAGALPHFEVSRNRLIAALLNTLLHEQRSISRRELIDEYKKRLLISGQDESLDEKIRRLLDEQKK